MRTTGGKHRDFRLNLLLVQGLYAEQIKFYCLNRLPTNVARITSAILRKFDIMSAPGKAGSYVSSILPKFPSNIRAVTRETD